MAPAGSKRSTSAWGKRRRSRSIARTGRTGSVRVTACVIMLEWYFSRIVTKVPSTAEPSNPPRLWVVRKTMMKLRM